MLKSKVSEKCFSVDKFSCQYHWVRQQKALGNNTLFLLEDGIPIFESLTWILGSYRAARHNWSNSKVCQSSESCNSLFLLFSAFSENGLCSFLLPLSVLCVSALCCAHNTFTDKINTARTLIKCYIQLVLLIFRYHKAMWEQLSFNSSLAVNPSHALMLRK